MVEATCHCRAVRIQLSVEPTSLTECNCSICRRLGTLWTYHHPNDVNFVAGAGETASYVWGDRTLEFHRCATCGCTTHWEPVNKEGAKRMGINARLMDPETIARARIHHFDGAATFRRLD